jgi:hypothetical protein
MKAFISILILIVAHRQWRNMGQHHNTAALRSKWHLVPIRVTFPHHLRRMFRTYGKSTKGMGV